jgi:pimeloyl-ACP methyl ester carboxylesterase
MLRMARIIGYVVLGAGLGLLAGCPLLPPPLPPPDEVLRGLSAAILQPELTCAELRDDFELNDLPLVDTPDEVGIPYQEVRLAVAGGHELRVWMMPGGTRGVVVVSPGNSGPMSCYLFTAQLLTEGGWTVVLYDYEGFGQSTGEPSLLTLRDDLDAVVDWTREQTGHDRVTLFGMSLGSIPSVAAAVERPWVVNGVILDSPVALGVQIERFDRLVQGRAAEILAIVQFWAPWLVAEDHIGWMTAPLLVLLGDEDVVTPPGTVQVLYDHARGPKKLVVFEGLGHAAAQFLRTADYRAEVEAFLTEVWGE